MRLRHAAVRGIGWGLAAVVAGPGLLLGACGAASAAAPDGTVCGVAMDSLDKPPLTLRLQRLHHAYRVDGSSSTFRLKALNGTRVGCTGVRPVVVFGARGAGLRQGDVRLQWRRGRAGHWTRVRMVAAQGALVGQIGPAKGLTLSAGGRVSVPLRIRFARSAPTGQWLTMAVGYEPVTLAGRVVPLPVGITDPHYFRVVRVSAAAGAGKGAGAAGGGGVGKTSGAGARVGAPSGGGGGAGAGAASGAGTRAGASTDRGAELARTGGPGAGAAAVAGVAALAVGGGAGLVVLARRRAQAPR